MRTEPVAILGAVEAVIVAVLGALVAVGVIDTGFEQSIAAAVAALVPLIGSLFARSKVSPAPKRG